MTWASLTPRTRSTWVSTFVNILMVNSLMGLSVDLVKLDLAAEVGTGKILTAIETNENLI
jgi:hypothetical protein